MFILRGGRHRRWVTTELSSIASIHSTLFNNLAEQTITFQRKHLIQMNSTICLKHIAHNISSYKLNIWSQLRSSILSPPETPPSSPASASILFLGFKWVQHLIHGIIFTQNLLLEYMPHYYVLLLSQRNIRFVCCSRVVVVVATRTIHPPSRMEDLQNVFLHLRPSADTKAMN